VASLRNDASMTETRTFAIDHGEVARVDAWIESLGQRWGESQRTTFAARICVAELFSNVIEHGGAKSDLDRITLTITRRRDGIGIEFMDTCARFDPTAVAARVQDSSIESATIGGRGLLLIRNYAKDFIYHYDGSGNRITLRIESD
jgi:anti-sigma regulatory factor (Ser/Thr protein kinase)